jgi:hypothetical protein
LYVVLVTKTVQGPPAPHTAGVAVAVGVFVAVGVGVLVGVFVGVLVGVFVGVSEGVLVGVGVATAKLRTTVGCDSLVPFLAVMVTATSDPTLAAFTTIERHALPAGITIEDGTGKMLGRLLFKATVVPPAGAGPVKQTVILPRPPLRITVWTLSDRRMGALTITVRLTLHAPVEAETTTVVSTATGCAVAAKVYSVDPAGTVTVAGRVMAAFEELMVTLAPPAGAGAERRTRNVTWWPPVALPEPNRWSTQGVVLATDPVPWAPVRPSRPIAPATTVIADANMPRRERRDASTRANVSKRAPSMR